MDFDSDSRCIMCGKYSHGYNKFCPDCLKKWGG